MGPNRDAAAILAQMEPKDAAAILDEMSTEAARIVTQQLIAMSR